MNKKREPKRKEQNKQRRKKRNQQKKRKKNPKRTRNQFKKIKLPIKERVKKMRKLSLRKTIKRKNDYLSLCFFLNLANRK